MSQENSNQQPQQDNNKVQKAFENNLRKLTAILGDESKLRPQTKINNAQLAEITASLFEEDTKRLEQEVKEGIRALVTAKITFDRAVKEKEGELNKLKIEKQKEFNQSASNLFQKIDDIGKKEAEYAAALSAMSGQIEESEEE